MEKEKPIAKLSFEEALKELESIVRSLESGGQDLDTSIKDYARGNLLRQHCEKKLAEAKLKVEKIVAGEDGSLKTEAMDAE